VIYNFIIEFNPDFIFLGISVDKNNIDYIVCEISQKLNIKTGSIQDYYGYFGSYNNAVKPDYFFVIDDYAKLLTDKTMICESEKIIITGSPKHYDYYNKIDKWNKDFQNISYRNSEIILFLQPLEIPGITSNLINLCSELNEIEPGYILNVKPHPLDEDSKILKDLSTNYSFKILDFENKPIELLLMYFSNIFNCFSTISYDYYFLTKHILSIRRTKLHNLLIGEDIFSSIAKLNFDISMTPQYKIGVNIKDSQSLKEALKSIFNFPKINTFRMKSLNNNNYNMAVENIINIIKGV